MYAAMKTNFVGQADKTSTEKVNPHCITQTSRNHLMFTSKLARLKDYITLLVEVLYELRI